MRFLVIVLLLIIVSCKSYRKVTIVDEWTVQGNVKYVVYRYDYYKNDTLYASALDTIPSDSKEYDHRNRKITQRVNMDYQY